MYTYVVHKLISGIMYIRLSGITESNKRHQQKVLDFLIIVEYPSMAAPKAAGQYGKPLKIR